MYRDRGTMKTSNENVNRCTKKMIFPINLPLLSFALYFCDRTPSILMLHIAINGDQACLPWMMSSSSASWISLTILSRDAARFESLCCLSSIENDKRFESNDLFLSLAKIALNHYI